jgi:hypothetical protein
VRTLEIHSEAALGLREISGLTAGPGPRLLAVGDEAFAVASAEIGDDGGPGRPRCHDLTPALRDAGIDLRHGSGFEGIACDGDGTLVLLQEEQARLLVVAPDLARLLHVIALAVPHGCAALNEAWRRRKNSRGEGLLLLDHGHVLIARERREPCLIEFGPAGDPPLGVDAGTVLTGRFRCPDVETTLVPLAVWPVDAEVLPTVNDLALGPDGRVHALSAERRLIARLAQRLTPGEPARTTAAWRIPGGHAGRAEGLTFLPSGRPAVGLDTKRSGNNLIILARLDDL